MSYIYVYIYITTTVYQYNVGKTLCKYVDVYVYMCALL